MHISNLAILNKKEIELIHQESLKIIEETGIKLDDLEILKILNDYDVKIDFENKIIKIPRKTANYFLTVLPKKIKMFAIDPKFDIDLGKKTLYRPISGCISIVDENNFKRADSDDVKTVAKLVQNLDFMDFNATAILPSDVAEKAMDVTAAKINFENCSKHILVDTLNKQSFEAVLEMAFKISGGESNFKERPFFQVHFPATSPLIFDRNACDNIKIAVKFNIPIRVGSSPMSGTSGPITLAGTMLLMNTEVVGGMIITQMLKEGCPVFYGCAPSIFDMKFGNFSWGAAEAVKMSSSSVGLGRKINSFVTTIGFATDSKIPDQQSAIERSMNLLLGALSGVDILAGAGLLEGELSYDPIQLVIDNEIAMYVENLLKGIEINENNLSSSSIKKIGIGGNYLNTEETLKLYKSEHEATDLLDRRSRGSWNKIEDKGIYSKARKIMENIIASDSKSVLADRTLGEIQEVYDNYMKNIK